jgi:23S rRNA (guanosine2251-2'-O)-methyltransferase
VVIGSSKIAKKRATWKMRNPQSSKHGRPQGGKDRAPYRRSGKPERSSEDDSGPAVLYGWHSVSAALRNPERRILRILATENALRRLQEEGVPLPVAPELVRPDAIAARLSPDSVHQGLLAEAEPLEAPGVEDLSDGIVLVLDQITDPHNVGAILRSAAAFGVRAIVLTARHSPEATGVLAKAASGALEHVPLVAVPNLSRGMAALKEQGFLLIGLDSEGDDNLAEMPLRAPLALVLGAEGKGLRHLTRATCDRVARLRLSGAISSLNVSNAAAVSLYIATTRLTSAESL